MKFTLTEVYKDGLVLPKSYFLLSAVSPSMPELVLKRYVLARAPLLWSRLWLAKFELIAVELKMRRFYKRLGA